MAQLKSLMDELDIINEKLERMNGLLTTALEKYQALQTCDAELHVHPTTEQGGLWDCANCENRQIGAIFPECPNCGTARPERSAVG